jgi:hypothetical protein
MSARKLYHITPRRNVPSICEFGLIPSYGRGMMEGRQLSKPKMGKVFLTDDPEWVLREQCGRAWCKKNDPVLFEVDVEGIDVRVCLYWWRADGLPVVSEHEFFVDGCIHRSRLSHGDIALFLDKLP